LKNVGKRLDAMYYKYVQKLRNSDSETNRRGE